MTRPAKIALAAAIAFLIGCAAGRCSTPEAAADSWAYPTPGDNTALLQEFVDVLAYVENKYGTGPLSVTTDWLDDNTYAVASASGITVNKKWSTGSVEALNASLADGAANGWVNSGGMCSGVQSLALHESAHLIDGTRGFMPRLNVRALYGPYPTGLEALSQYSLNPDGSLNYGEALAEAFTAVECGVADQAEWDLYWMLIS